MDTATVGLTKLVEATRHVATSTWFIPLAVVLLIVFYPIYNLTLNPLASYPGPTLWCMSRIPWHVSLHKGELHRKMHEFHEKYGPIVRIAPNELSYTHPDAWRDIYGNKSFERNEFWFRRPSWEPHSIMGNDEPAHTRIRRAFMGAFSEAGVKDMCPLVERYVNMMAMKLNEVVRSSRGSGVIDLVDWLNFTTFDISGDLSFGEAFGSVEKAKAHPWVEISCQFGKGVAMISSINFLWPLNEILAAVMPRGVAGEFDPDVIPKDVREKFAYHRGLTSQKVGKRLNLAQDRPDFMSSVEKYNAEMKQKGHEDRIITREELDHNMTIFVFAGSETTSSALSGILRYILQDERVRLALEAEIRDNFQTEDEITVASVTKLEYMTAVISEGLRLAPPVVVGVPRQSPVGGENVCGRRVPGGTLVAINQYAAHRTSANWTNPDMFIPERFLKNHGLAGDEMGIYQPFLIGRHVCIGYRLAWAEMRLILARLFFAFDIELEQPDRVDDFGQQSSYIFWAKDPLMVKLKERTP